MASSPTSVVIGTSPTPDISGATPNNTTTVSIPDHQLYESPNCRSIRVGDWYITASTNPISPAYQCDALQASLGIPLPEMTFGNNHLVLHHRPSGFMYTFRTEDALRYVKKGELEDGDGGVKVEYAEKWLQSRTGQNASLPMPTTVPTKPYDWTYTTTYQGHLFKNSPPPSALPTSSSSWTASDPEDPSQSIPMSELMRPDPILFYAEIPLFEDELHDNGSSNLLVRIRVMPTCIFILSRFTLRVDNVLFRTHDTRLYHSFSSSPPTFIRETGGWEAPYDRVQRHLPKRNDLTPLTDPTFIAKILTELPKHVSQREGAKTRWRGMGTRKEIIHLT
ncbi:hypothetical protein AX16_003114 [Volvariella volvacea WC 439]|nr:hypothetical protein AX16_003114 [Volvariella volvacea WC 439]